MHETIETVARLDLLQVIAQIGAMGHGIIAVLFLLSISAWTIIFYKLRMFRTVSKESEQFLRIYHENGDFAEIYTACVYFRIAPVVHIFNAGYVELQRIRKEMKALEMQQKSKAELAFSGWMEDFTDVLQQTIARETLSLQSFLIVLAVVTAVSPLLGLLGTVWGVMLSFWTIGLQGQTNLSMLAPGISAALTTTVAGLLAAIPAVIAYNALANRVNAFASEMECFASEFTGGVRRELLMNL